MNEKKFELFESDIVKLSTYETIEEYKLCWDVILSKTNLHELHYDNEIFKQILKRILKKIFLK